MMWIKGPVTEPHISGLVPNQSNRHSTLHSQTLSLNVPWGLSDDQARLRLVITQCVLCMRKVCRVCMCRVCMLSCHGVTFVVVQSSFLLSVRFSQRLPFQNFNEKSTSLRASVNCKRAKIAIEQTWTFISLSLQASFSQYPRPNTGFWMLPGSHKYRPESAPTNNEQVMGYTVRTDKASDWWIQHDQLCTQRTQLAVFSGCLKVGGFAWNSPQRRKKKKKKTAYRVPRVSHFHILVHGRTLFG